MPMTLAAAWLALMLQPVAAPDARAKTEEQVKNAVLGSNIAYAKNELPVYWTFFAPDLTQWLPEGRVDLPTYKKQWEAFVKGGGRVEQADVADLVVQLSPSGDSAVASYRLTVTTRQADGKASTDVMQETDVLFKRLGGWKIVHLHYSPAKMSREGGAPVPARAGPASPAPVELRSFFRVSDTTGLTRRSDDRSGRLGSLRALASR